MFLKIIEVHSGSCSAEDDMVRFEDKSNIVPFIVSEANSVILTIAGYVIF